MKIPLRVYRKIVKPGLFKKCDIFSVLSQTSVFACWSRSRNFCCKIFLTVTNNLNYRYLFDHLTFLTFQIIFGYFYFRVIRGYAECKCSLNFDFKVAIVDSTYNFEKNIALEIHMTN